MAGFAVCILLLQGGLALWLGLPGQVTIDALIQLYEGRTHQTISFHPPLMSIMLGALDKLGDAPIGFVLISVSLLTAATWHVLRDIRVTRNWGLAAATFCLLNPVILAYAGILWKDVLFAHAVVLLFLALSRWQRAGVKPGALGSLAVFVLLTAVVGLRQQGMLFSLVGAAWFSALRIRGRTGRIVLTMALFVLPILVDGQLARHVQRPWDQSIPSSQMGFKILMRYDLAGILANGGQLTEHAAPALRRSLEASIPYYTPARVDFLDQVPIHNWWHISMADNVRIWRESLLGSPLAYLKHRTHVAAAIFGLGDMHQCAVIDSGVQGPFEHPWVSGELTSLLGLTPGPNHSTDLVISYASDYANTPLFMHWAYALVLIAVTIGLWKKRAFVLVSLTVCSLIFMLSYALIGIACDFRYTYTLTVATSLLTAWWCLHSGHPPQRHDAQR